MKNRSILWYRQDLRIHDNEALYEALRWNDEVIPVYVFDPRVFTGISIFGNRRMSVHRAQFIIDSVADLKHSWQKLGADLIIRIGHPEEIIFDLAKEFKTDVVFCNRERTRDELSVQDLLEQKLWTIGQEIRFTRGKMLYYTQDLPFPVTQTPNNFSVFRKELEKIVPVRQLLPIPDSVTNVFSKYSTGLVPSLIDLGFGTNSIVHEHRKGGESEGIKQLKTFVWTPDGLPQYKAKDKHLNEPLFSSNLSPWMAQGCISPKMVYHEIKSFESIYGSKENSQSLITELIRRDYCRLIAKKYENKIFEPGGIATKSLPDKSDQDYLFNLWKEGRVGIPIIDAAMKALSQTGYISFPLRQTCAHFLIHVLKVHWRMGADWYESNLIDYDVATNWVNWMILAGLLPDSLEEKTMSAEYLSKKYDPEGQYIKTYLPALKNIPANKINRLDLLSIDEQKEYGVLIGKDYPKSIT